MSNRILKHIISRDSACKNFILSLADEMKLDFLILLPDGKPVLGKETPDMHQEFAINYNQESLGILKTTDARGKLLVDMFNLLIKKEIEKKKIGVEVLGLYREVNMIYNFSEQISEKIDIYSIASFALQEAIQIIHATHGLFLSYDQDTGEVNKLSSHGTNPNDNKNLAINNAMLKEFILTGNSAIISKFKIKENDATNHLESLMFAPLKVKDRYLGLLMVGHNSKDEFTAAELKLLTTIALQSASALDSALLYQKGLKEANEREEAIRKMHEVSLKFVPFEFLKSLGKSSLPQVALGDQVEREVTVLFADIRDFTTISERMEPSENFLFINSFNKKMGPIIRKNNGFIMQYLGDGFMAIFPGGSQDAVKASVEMHDSLKEYNQGLNGANWPTIKIGIGMQNGKLIMGITGDVDRLDAAIISDTVNTASRIEGLSKHYGTSILLTGECYNTMSDLDKFNFRYLGLVKVKGKHNPLELFECINGDSKELYDLKMETLPTFEKAIAYYYNREFAMAAVTFQQVIKINKQDKTARLFLNRSAQLITEAIDDEWKGIEVAYHTK
jgi:class 3 adenylate cyclase